MKRKSIKTILMCAAFVSTTVLSAGMMPGMDMMDDMMGKDTKGSSSGMKMPEIPGMDSGSDGIKMPKIPDMPKIPSMDSIKDGKMPEMPSMDKIKEKLPEVSSTNVGKDSVEVSEMPSMDNMPFFGKDAKNDKNPMDMLEDMMGKKDKDTSGFKMPFFN